MKEGGPGSKTREQIIARDVMFRATGHYPDCALRGCAQTGCSDARFVSRWHEGRRS